MNSLLHEKKAFKEISSEELEELNAGLEEEGRKIEIIPSKLVWTKKPDPNNPAQGKNKVRWVICGNFEEKKESEQTYSGGADSTALRAVVSTASDRQWSGATVDVKTAFLNAEMSQEEEDEVLVDSTSNHPHRERIVLRSSKSGVWAEEIASIVGEMQRWRSETAGDWSPSSRRKEKFEAFSAGFGTESLEDLSRWWGTLCHVGQSRTGHDLCGWHLNRNGSQKVQFVSWVSRFPRWRMKTVDGRIGGSHKHPTSHRCWRMRLKKWKGERYQFQENWWRRCQKMRKKLEWQRWGQPKK